MKAIADAIVYAAAYIDSRDQREEFDDDDSDESAMSHIMAYLSHATPAEEDALAAAAQRSSQRGAIVAPPSATHD